MKKVILPAFIVGLMVLTSGCQNTANSIENAEKTMTPNTIVDRRYTTDGFLKDRLKLVRVDTSVTPNGFFQVQVTAINVRTGGLAQLWSSMTGENPYDIDYKFSWLNKQGIAVDSMLSRWGQMTVKPGETIYIKGVAPIRDCRDFLLNIKELD